jgi:sarcosine oxidase
MVMSLSVIIAGLGAMGSAAAFHLAQRGAKVIGLDKFAPPHPFGSSHGQSRIIREAYFEHPAYVPLVQRAYELWRELEAVVGEPLLRITGGLMVGEPESELVTGALRSAQLHGLAHEVLSADEVQRRFPVFRLPDHFVAVYEPRAGILSPERCIAAHLTAAQRHGADLRFGEALTAWQADGEGVMVMTDKGRYRADALVLSVGSWLPNLMPSLPLQVERQVMFWFRPKRNGDRFAPDRCPIFIVEFAPSRFFYGFPDLGEGVKVARHHEGELCTPETVRRMVDETEVAAMRELVRPFLPDADGEFLRAEVCLYTNTPDGHFLLDCHPEHPQVLLVSPCSGHGFKFASAIGECVADWLLTNSVRHDLSLFRYRWGDGKRRQNQEAQQ